MESVPAIRRVVLASYVRAVEAGRGGSRTPFRAWVLASVDEARAVLERVVGPVESFTIEAATPEARPVEARPVPVPAPVVPLRPASVLPVQSVAEPKVGPDRLARAPAALGRAPP